MKRMIAATLVACVAALVPCVANGAGKPIGQQPDSTTPPPADSQAYDLAVVHAQDLGERVMSRGTPGITMGSVQNPEELSSMISHDPSVAPSAGYWISVTGYDFKPITSSALPVYTNWGCFSTTDSAPLIAQVFLPSGAVVNQLEINYYRTAAYTSSLLFAEYHYDGASAFSLITANASGTSGTGYNIASGGPVTVDNFNWSYALYWSNTGNANNRLCGANVGYTMTATGTYNPVTPCRRIDTRTGTGTTATPLTPTTRNFQITGGCSVPTGATGITANVTVVNTSNNGYVAIWPQGTSWPGNSTVNYTAGSIVANAADLVLGSTGMVSAYCFAGTTDLVIDITGYFY